MNVKVFIHYKDFDKDGNVTGESEHEANSLVIGFMKVLAAMFGSLTLATIDTSNTSRNNVGADADNFDVAAAAGVTTTGIVVGTGTTAVTISDYNLATPIAHGTGAGQLSYGAVTFDANTTTSGSSVFFQIYRTLTNNTASTITIEEVGLVGAGSTTGWYFLYDRTLSTKALTAGAATAITYKIQITV